MEDEGRCSAHDYIVPIVSQDGRYEPRNEPAEIIISIKER